MATKLGRVVTYREGFLVTKSHDSFITWFCEITRQTKNIYYHSVYGYDTWKDGDLN